MDDARPHVQPQHVTAELLDVKELAQVLRVSESTIRRLLRGQQIPSVRIGSRVLFTRQHVAEITAMYEVRPVTPMRTPTGTPRRRRVS